MAQQSLLERIRKDYWRNKVLILMILPVIIYFLVFKYFPMYGALIAFKNFKPRLGFAGSKWVGFEQFEKFFNSRYFSRILGNTIKLSLMEIVFGFPAPVILALMLNEVRRNKFKRAVQTITYMPHFISMVVMCGIVVSFCDTNGIVTRFFSSLTETAPRNLLTVPAYFRPIYVISGIWQEVGFGSIIYLSALSTIDPVLYEAATIDGANRWKQLIHVTIPGILMTVMIMLLLRVGRIMSVGYEKVLLLYNASTYESAEIISTFVYKRGLLDSDYSLGAAIDLFNSVINLVLLLVFNSLSKRLTETSLF
ncbi:MAG: ABC transporter permease [Christensenellales bacterium]